MESLILLIALQVGLDPALLKAVCYQESRLQNVNTMHDGKSTSYGPMQIKKIAVRQIASYSVNMNDPKQSVLMGAKYLKYSIKKCGNVKSGLAHYNTGKCLNKPTKNGYVDKVMKYYYKYKKENNKQFYCQNFWEEK